MTFTIDQNMLYTIIVALFIYDLIRVAIGAFTAILLKQAARKPSERDSSGRGPGGMVVKGKDSILKDSEATQKTQ